MRSTLLFLFLAQLVCLHATPTPSTTCNGGKSKSAAAATCQTSFGIPASKLGPPGNNPLFVRGGELSEPKTLDEVEALVSNAAMNNQLVVIDFSATWCGPCQMIAPKFKEMSNSIANVVFLKVDVDENAETAAKYSVSAMPTFLFIKEGEVVDRLMGANAERLKEMIEELM